MAILDRESTMKVNVGGGKKDVPFRHKFYQSFNDIMDELGNDKSKQQSHVDFVNSAYEAEAKVSARNKYLQGDGAKFKAIDDQLKAYLESFKKVKKREASEKETADARERITSAVMATFELLEAEAEA
jgi:translation initiation factor 2 beta subunit (eIF-2beta)/eIF-5